MKVVSLKREKKKVNVILMSEMNKIVYVIMKTPGEVTV